MPKMTDDPIVQEFCLMGCNEFVVTTNTAYSDMNIDRRLFIVLGSNATNAQTG